MDHNDASNYYGYPFRPEGHEAARAMGLPGTLDDLDVVDLSLTKADRPPGTLAGLRRTASGRVDIEGTMTFTLTEKQKALWTEFLAKAQEDEKPAPFVDAPPGTTKKVAAAKMRDGVRHDSGVTLGECGHPIGCLMHGDAGSVFCRWCEEVSWLHVAIDELETRLKEGKVANGG